MKKKKSTALIFIGEETISPVKMNGVSIDD